VRYTCHCHNGTDSDCMLRTPVYSSVQFR